MPPVPPAMYLPEAHTGDPQGPVGGDCGPQTEPLEPLAPARRLPPTLCVGILLALAGSQFSWQESRRSCRRCAHCARIGSPVLTAGRPPSPGGVELLCCSCWVLGEVWGSSYPVTPSPEHGLMKGGPRPRQGSHKLLLEGSGSRGS